MSRWEIKTCFLHNILPFLLYNSSIFCGLLQKQYLCSGSDSWRLHRVEVQVVIDKVWRSYVGTHSLLKLLPTANSISHIWYAQSLQNTKSVQPRTMTTTFVQISIYIKNRQGPIQGSRAETCMLPVAADKFIVSGEGRGCPGCLVQKTSKLIMTPPPSPHLSSSQQCTDFLFDRLWHCTMSLIV